MKFPFFLLYNDVDATRTSQSRTTTKYPCCIKIHPSFHRTYWSPEAQATSVREAPLLVSIGSDLCCFSGSHVVYSLQKTRRYKVISIDNHHNSLPAALTQVTALAREELPEEHTEQDLESTIIDAHDCDLTKPEQVKEVFAKYVKGGIWGVVHIAVSFMRNRTFRVADSFCRRTKPSVNRQKSLLLTIKTMSLPPSRYCKSWANSNATE